MWNDGGSFPYVPNHPTLPPRSRTIQSSPIEVGLPLLGRGTSPLATSCCTDPWRAALTACCTSCHSLATRGPGNPRCAPSVRPAFGGVYALTPPFAPSPPCLPSHHPLSCFTAIALWTLGCHGLLAALSRLTAFPNSVLRSAPFSLMVKAVGKTRAVRPRP